MTGPKWPDCRYSYAIIEASGQNGLIHGPIEKITFSIREDKFLGPNFCRQGYFVMKRYLVFAGSDYYPLGGWEDFKGAFDTKEEATEFIARGNWDWSQIISLEKSGIIEVFRKED